MARLKEARDPNTIEKDWETNPRWNGITRDYTAEDVLRLRGSIDIQYTLAEMGAERLWQLLETEPFVNALGALTGNQAMQQVKAGLDAGKSVEEIKAGMQWDPYSDWAMTQEWGPMNVEGMARWLQQN